MYDDGIMDQRNTLSSTIELFKLSGSDQSVLLLPLIMVLMSDFALSRNLILRLVSTLLEKIDATYYPTISEITEISKSKIVLTELYLDHLILALKVIYG